MALKKTAKYYRDNPEAKAKKYAYDKEFKKSPEQRAKKKELNAIRYKAKKMGLNIKGKDYDHKQGKFIDSSVNRGQAEKSRLKGSKRRRRRS